MAKIECNKITAQAKVLFWNSQVQNEIQSPTDLTKAWKIVKRLKNTYNPSLTPLIHNNRTFSSDEEKANLLAETFAATKTKHNIPSPIPKYIASEEAKPKYQDPQPSPLDHHSPINLPFSISELEAVLNQIKLTKSTPGQDDITYAMIKHLPATGKTLILELINKCYSDGSLPKIWQHGIVIPILKPPKPRNLTNSYCPITLTSHLSKLFEKLIKNRLEFYLDKTNAIPIVQAGFRKHRSCADQLYTLSSLIIQAFKKRKSASMFFLCQTGLWRRLPPKTSL